MFDIFANDWPVAVDSTDPRNQFHERALHEARIATDYRQDAAPTPARGAGLVARVRVALAGGLATSAQVCMDCPA